MDTQVQVPEAIRALAQRKSGLIPIRLEMFGRQGNTGSIDTKWRAVSNFEHATLCAAFGLDPCSYWFDLPRSALGVGAAQVGFGSHTTGRRVIDGFVFNGPRGSEPVGKLTVCWESERFRDTDPMDRREQLRLGGG